MVQYQLLFMMIFVLGIGGGFHYGFQISVVNAPSPYIKSFINETWQTRYHSYISENTLTLLWSSIVSIYSIGGVIGALGAGYVSGKYGKKKCQLWNTLILMGAALLSGLSREAGSFEMIMVGRFLLGFSSGLGLNLHAQYAGEIAPRKFRGFTNTSVSIFVTAGKCFGQIFGLREILGTETRWPLLLAVSGISSVIQLVTLPFFPESPPYLLMQKGNKEACMKAVKQLWGDGDHRDEIEDMMREQAARKGTKTLSALDLLREKSLRWQLYCVLAMIITLQLCGINAIYFYSYEVFEKAGFLPDQIPYITLGVGIGEITSVIICSLLVERFGRKTLLLSGYALMVSTLGLLTVTLSLQKHFSWMPFCSVALIFMFNISFGSGPGGVSVTVCVEIFSQSSRAAALVIFGFLNWTGLYLLGMIFPYIAAGLGHFCFLIFLGIILISGIFIYLFLPETKGKSILEISDEFNKLNFRRKHIEVTTADWQQQQLQHCTISTKF
ncbi:solute carrier family 2, facilitated glucose transporter member 11 isoform X2 [Microcaecilia unicolor]|uniref:Solute carrier family 2, facilitated glucose transporter member 5 n=1 Tax=Microcaecilia unicolor TaxID=1415580 RepID=A0A6P7Z646_9AMPH|nr:solute carrier family 2, facilitated glucose transporter member 11-like isoform X2 [Microcaecilia unicolor]XP_030074812.1 solute carrier family 2, facilitated glucose transporter member 11-like isoform X2 [Microcaecilia unicolor]